MTFQEYCASKKIDVVKFKKSEADLFHELNQVFDQVHPDSFTSQKKFLLNGLRRRYKLEDVKSDSVTKKNTSAPKPIIPKKKEVVANNSTEANSKPRPKVVIPTPKKGVAKPMIPKVADSPEKAAKKPASPLKPKIGSPNKSAALKPKITPKKKDE